MIDRSLMAHAEFEFVVLGDTHYMLDPGGRSLEFESRRKQTARADTALGLAASLRPDFIVHMGDLVQEYPETRRHEEALEKARAQLEGLGVNVFHVAGNHDVGDKLDPAMPTLPVTSESLERYRSRFGPSWYSFDRRGCHFIVVNSQILNTDLPESVSQRDWLERDLERHGRKRVFLFLHLPLFLEHPDEPCVGNYDNIGQPDRVWILDLVRRHRVEAVCAAHVHFAFLNTFGPTRIYNVPSTSFVRPGFSHLFTGPSPPEQGRDDAPKLGFNLFRVFPDRTDVHFIRTGGAVTLEEASDGAPKRLLTRNSAGLPSSPLGLTLLHPLATRTEIPIAFPSVVRQRVRNDYPMLAGQELGATAVRLPVADLDDAFQRERIRILREEGLRLTATAPASSAADLSEYVRRRPEPVDTWEIQLPGALLPSGDLGRALGGWERGTSARFALAPVLPGEIRPGKQHPRTRIGYLPGELQELNRGLADLDVCVDRVLCRVDEGEPWHAVRGVPDAGTLSHVGAVDLAVAFTSRDDVRNANCAAEALFAGVVLPGARIYFEPLIDLDRTLDVAHGLLDTSCNPRPAFHVLRTLNTALFHEPVSGAVPGGLELRGTAIRTLSVPGGFHTLITSHDRELPDLRGLTFPGISPDAPFRLYRLAEGSVQTGPLDRLLGCASGLSPPVLLTSGLPRG
ncbi:MAG: metallophosphoesterase [Gemmatimonadota bacterium]|nr:metallophosphoesterase [Gemmatimonadota bacterium]